MKKLLYTATALLTIFMVGCINFEEAKSEQYAPAPDFSIDAIATVADSSATFKIVLDQNNTTRFTVALLDDSVSVDEYPAAMDLLKGNVTPKERICLFNADTLIMRNDTTVSYISKNLLIQVTGNNITYSYTGLDPNTAYTLVAVVSNKFGITGDVKGLSITTTDNLAPDMSEASRSESYGSLKLAFSENMQRGEGKVTVQYYAPYDFSITGTVPDENVNLEINGKEITVSCDSVPAGALLLVSWEAGAFKDIKGNNCDANITEIDMETGTIENGCYFYIENKPFEFKKTSVENFGEAFVDYQAFAPSISYSKPLYINYDEEDDSQPEITLLYQEGEVKISMPANWIVADTSIVIAFEREMEYGAKVSFSIPEGAVVDAFGNPNKEFIVVDAWTRSYGLTDDDILGLYDIQYFSGVNEEIVQTSMLITRSGSGLKVSRLFFDDACLDAHFDGDLAILYIDDFQYMTTSESTGWDFYFVTAREDGYAQLQFVPSQQMFTSSLEAEIGEFVVTPTGASGWMDYSTVVVAEYAEDQNYGLSSDIMTGNYMMIFHNGYNDDPESLDTITCEIVAGDNDTTLILKDFVVDGIEFEGSEVIAYFDTLTGKLAIPDWQTLGEAFGYDFILSTYDLQDITFYCSPDGSAITNANDSPEGIVMGIYIYASPSNKGFYMLAEGDVILEQYDPEEGDEAEGAPMRHGSIQAGRSIQAHGSKPNK